MPNTHELFLFGHEFDEFLYSPIGEEKNGMELSVMSALARQNVDPWHEAARLSRLPRDVATQELCAMIAELPPGAPNRASPRSIAERLIAPLPLSAGSGASSQRGGGTLFSLADDGVLGDRPAIGGRRTRPGPDVERGRIAGDHAGLPLACRSIRSIK